MSSKHSSKSGTKSSSKSSRVVPTVAPTVAPSSTLENSFVPVSTNSRSSSSESTTYTNMNLSAFTFLQPPTPSTSKHCPCEPSALGRPKPDQNTHIRIYYTEPSPYGYNSGSYLIKEARYTTKQRWHSPGDDLVADDARSGSPVTAVGMWVKGSDDAEEVWETRVYYIDKDGLLQERTNRSHFAPTVKEDFEYELPTPSELVPPTPGWKATPLPAVSPLPATHLVAVRSESGVISVFYQAIDNSVGELRYLSGKGWDATTATVVAADVVKPGTPLAAVAGAWAEVSVFYVTPADTLAQTYSYDHGSWFEDGSLPTYKLDPSAMLSAVAWNFASPDFEVRVYTTDNDDNLREIAFSRGRGGWVPDVDDSPRYVGQQQPPQSAIAPPPATSSTPPPSATPPPPPPLSAVAAVLSERDWSTKVYFHPRPRVIVAEWDVCGAKAPAHAGVVARSAPTAAARRAVEEETRARIRADEERKQREEEERKQREEEERKRREEEARAAAEAAATPLQALANIEVGGSIDTSSNPVLAQQLQQLSGCSAGYKFLKVPGGFRCEGGAHFISDAELQRA